MSASEVFLPDRKGFLLLTGGLLGISVSRLTREAAVGPRKASGVRHCLGVTASRGGPRRERSKVSGLSFPRPFTWTPTTNSPNWSASERKDENELQLDSESKTNVERVWFGAMTTCRTFTARAEHSVWPRLLYYRLLLLLHSKLLLLWNSKRVLHTRNWNEEKRTSNVCILKVYSLHFTNNNCKI